MGQKVRVSVDECGMIVQERNESKVLDECRAVSTFVSDFLASVDRSQTRKRSLEAAMSLSSVLYNRDGGTHNGRTREGGGGVIGGDITSKKKMVLYFCEPQPEHTVKWKDTRYVCHKRRPLGAKSRQDLSIGLMEGIINFIIHKPSIELTC